MSFINAKIVGVSVNNADYLKEQNERGNPLFCVSSSSLREFSRCPHRWKLGYSSPGSEAKDWGSLVDCVVLTPNQFSDRYVIRPATYQNDDGESKPWNNNANVCKKWNKEQAGRTIISNEEYCLALDAKGRLLNDELISSWSSASDTQVHISGNWKDDDSGVLVPVKCLIDYAPRKDTEFASCLGDLKTVKSAALQPFQRLCFTLGWHVQAAFDLDMYVAATGEDRNSWCFIIQENYEPWEPARRLLSQDFIQIGRQTYQHALRQYCKCIKTGTWPGYDDHPDAIQGWSLVAPEPWMEFVAMEQAIESEQARATEESEEIMP